MKLRIQITRWILLAIILAIFLSGYLISGSIKQTIGYPLDDAWIHQVYARNLGIRGEWAFIPGHPSGGSTAPLWTFWLSLGYWLHLDHFFWSFFSGALALGTVAIIGALQVNRLTQQERGFPWFGLFLIGEWHLLWAALSGMETIWFTALILGIFLLLSYGRIKFWLVGLLIGISGWLRPDGVTLLGPAIMLLLLGQGRLRGKILDLLKLTSGFLIFFFPYLLFNQYYSNAIWPNTYFAKQVEYAVHLQQPFFQNLTSLIKLPIIGPGLALVPGFIFACYRFIDTRNWGGIVCVVWWLGFTILYALRLPLDYQHGRYLIPGMPIFWLIGWVGTIFMFSTNKVYLFGKKLIKFAWILALGLLWSAFLIIGGNAYSEDAAIINTEMVQTAKWVAENTPPDALIAAHDIGALGYFGNRELIDLAGLVSPEVIPFIGNESQLMGYIQKMQADYLVTFPGWYPEMTKSLVPIYQGNERYSIHAGGEHMTVYQVER